MALLGFGSPDALYAPNSKSPIGDKWHRLKPVRFSARKDETPQAEACATKNFLAAKLDKRTQSKQSGASGSNRVLRFSIKDN
jgi:hypothetical protein